jgi:hypothetical protein
MANQYGAGNPAPVAAVLTEARRLIEARPYQTRFFAALDTGQTEVYHDFGGAKRQRPKWVACSPTHPKAMLSLRGAVIAAAGSGPQAWPVLDHLFRWKPSPRIDEPATKRDALLMLDECLRSMNRAAPGPARAGPAKLEPISA